MTSIFCSASKVQGVGLQRILERCLPLARRVGEHGVRAYAMNEDFYVGLILILIFAEAIGLFGLIIAIILSNVGTAVSGSG